MKDALQFIWNHWPGTGWFIAAYIHLWHSGGLRTIWSNILGPKQAQAEVPPKQETKQI